MRYRLSFYMKSGHIITQEGVSEYEIRNEGDAIVAVRVTIPDRVKRQIAFKTLALSQIECVVVEEMS